MSARENTEPPADSGPMLMVATTSGTIRLDGVRYNYTRRSTILPSDHPLVRGLPGRFIPYGQPRLPLHQIVRDAAMPVVEQVVPAELEPPILVAEAPPEMFIPEVSGMVFPVDVVVTSRTRRTRTTAEDTKE